MVHGVRMWVLLLVAMRRRSLRCRRRPSCLRWRGRGRDIRAFGLDGPNDALVVLVATVQVVPVLSFCSTLVMMLMMVVLMVLLVVVVVVARRQLLGQGLGEDLSSGQCRLLAFLSFSSLWIIVAVVIRVIAVAHASLHFHT